MALQLNSKELDTFRKTLSRWKCAQFAIADAQITRQRRIKSNEGKIADYDADIQNYKDGKAHPIGKSVDERIAELRSLQQTMKNEIESYKAVYNAVKEKQAKALENGFALVTDAQAQAMADWIAEPLNDELYANAVDAVVEFFTNNGAVGVVANDAEKFLRPLGVKKLSAKKMCENKKVTGAGKATDIKTSFLGAICDYKVVADMLPDTHKWVNKIEKKTK